MMKTRLDELVNQFVRERSNVLIESGVRIHDAETDEEIGFIVMQMNNSQILLGYKPNSLFGRLAERFLTSEIKMESEGFYITYVSGMVLRQIVSAIDRLYTVDLFRIETNVGNGKILSEYAYVRLSKNRPYTIDEQ